MLKPLLLLLLFFPGWAQEYEEGTGAAVQKADRFAGRFFIRNTLIDIFGNEASEIIDRNYFKVGKQVGGPCDIYEQVYHEHDKMVDPTRECPGGKPAAKFPLYPKTNILRSSHMMKTCYELVYRRPIPKVFQGTSNFLKVVSKKFYPYGGDEKLQKKLHSKYKVWDEPRLKEALLTYCLSPGWQRL